MSERLLMPGTEIRKRLAGAAGRRRQRSLEPVPAAADQRRCPEAASFEWFDKYELVGMYTLTLECSTCWSDKLQL